MSSRDRQIMTHNITEGRIEYVPYGASYIGHLKMVQVPIFLYFFFNFNVHVPNGMSNIGQPIWDVLDPECQTWDVKYWMPHLGCDKT